MLLCIAGRKYFNASYAFIQVRKQVGCPVHEGERAYWVQCVVLCLSRHGPGLRHRQWFVAQPWTSAPAPCPLAAANFTTVTRLIQHGIEFAK